MRSSGPSPSSAKSTPGPVSDSAARGAGPAPAVEQAGLSFVDGGNQRFLSRLDGSAIQLKVRSAPQNDRFEHEADSAAAAIVGVGHHDGELSPAPAPLLQRKC